MRVVIQRAEEAFVEVSGKVTGVIGRGLMILLGIEEYYQMLVKGIVLIAAVGIDIKVRNTAKDGSHA